MVNAVIQDLDLRKQLSNADIMTVSAPCQGRSVLRRMQGIDGTIEFSEDEVFFLQCVLIELLKPKRIISEMTPPNKDYSDDHYTVSAQIESYGYEVTVTDQFPADLCGDIQARVRWILIGRRIQPGKILKPFDITSDLRCRVPKPLSSILEPVHHFKLPHECWVSKDFVQLFEEPKPYPEGMTEPDSGTHGFVGGTKINNWENAQLTMLLLRLRTDNIPQAHRDGYLVIGPDTTQDVMTNPIVAKVYTLIYNIMRRTASCGNHTKYLIDLYGNQKCLKAAQKMRQYGTSGNVKVDEANLSKLTTFAVGYYSGGRLKGHVSVGNLKPDAWSHRANTLWHKDSLMKMPKAIDT